MNKKKLLLIFGSILIVIILLFIISRRLSVPKQTLPVPTVTPEITTVIFPTAVDMTSLKIISTDPADQATGVSLNQKISISINRAFDISQLDLIVSPKFEYSKSQKDSTLIVTPLVSLQTGTLYTYSLWDKTNSENFRRTFTFTTTGTTPEFLPDTRPEEAIKAEEDFIRENYPDAFLKNNSPYSTDTFSITADVRSSPQDNFYFTVTLKSTDQDAAKQDFINWLKSLRLTDQQIQALEIIYN